MADDRRRRTQASAAAKDRLDVVAVRIEHEGGIVAGWVTFRRVAKPGRAVIGPPGLQVGRAEGVALGAASGREVGTLLHAMRMKTVDPENRIIQVERRPPRCTCERGLRVLWRYASAADLTFLPVLPS